MRTRVLIGIALAAALAAHAADEAAAGNFPQILKTCDLYTAFNGTYVECLTFGM